MTKWSKDTIPVINLLNEETIKRMEERIAELETFVAKVRDDDNHITEDTEFHTFCIYCEAEKLLPRGKNS